MASTPSATRTAAPALGVTLERPPGVLQRLSWRFRDPRSWARLRLVSDLVVLYAAAAAALLADSGLRGTWSNRWLAAIFPVFVVLLLRARRTPDERMDGTLFDSAAHVIGVVSLAAMLTVALESIFGAKQPLALPVRLWLFGFVYLGIVRAILFSIRRSAVRSGVFSVPTLVVGAGVVGTHLVRRLTGQATYGLRPVGIIDADPMPNVKPGDVGVPILGGLNDLEQAIASTKARHVILAFSAAPDYVLVSKVRQLEALGVGVSLVPRLYESINERTTLDHVGGLPLLTLHSIDPRSWQFAVKHALDQSLAFLTLVAMSPLMVLISVGVKLSSPGPVLFRQRRVGRDGREFDVLKYRTMREPTAPPSGFVPEEGLAPGGVEGGDRRTPIGRVLRELSLDELPQLFNVLRGEMSIVGPRPERPEYVKRFARDVSRYQDRHRVKSGITGWAQVHGLRGQTSIADRVEWDNWYIQNWSLGLDIRILALTVAEVLRFRESL